MPGILAPAAFRTVAVQVPMAHVVGDGAVAPPLQRPERLRAVSVDVAIDVLAGAVTDGPVVRRAAIGPGPVGIDPGTGLGPCEHERLERDAPDVGHDGSAHLIACAVLHAGHDRLPDGSASGALFAAGVLIRFQAADVGLVRVERPGEEHSGVAPGRPDAVRQVPGGRLADPEHPRELQARDALRVRGE